MQILEISPAELIPYENNPRFNDDAVEYVAKSIEKYGFKVPIVIDKDNVIVTGHTRWKAANVLGLHSVPCIRADDLTEEEVREFRVIDNKLSELSEWDYDKLEIELEEIDIDLSDFGMDIDFSDEIMIDDIDEDDEGYYGDERERTDNAYNLGIIDYSALTDDFWQMPIIENNDFVPHDLIGFNYAKTSERTDCGIHFYVDDYQFERVWNYPEKYTDILKKFECILSPDFSLYMDMPMPMKIWNIYRSRQIGQFYQSQGIKVIPTVSWAEPETFEFCFLGIPKGSVVSVSTVGVRRYEDAVATWKNGMDEMIRQIEPSKILIYGGKLEYDYHGIETFYFTNKVTEEWTNGR